MPDRKRLGRPLGSGKGSKYPYRVTVPLTAEQFDTLASTSEASGATAADILRAGLERLITDIETDPQRHNPRAERTSDAFRQWFIDQLRRAALTASDRHEKE